MKKTKILQGAEVVPNLFPLAIETVSISVKVEITTKFKLLTVTHIFPDSDRPELTLVNLKGCLGAYRLDDFHVPTTRTDLVMLALFTRLRVIREKIWASLSGFPKVSAS